MFIGTIWVPVQDASHIRRMAKSLKKPISEYICQIAQKWWNEPINKRDGDTWKIIPSAPKQKCKCKMEELGYTLTTEVAEKVWYAANAYQISTNEFLKRIVMADVYEWYTAPNLIHGGSACRHYLRGYGWSEPKPTNGDWTQDGIMGDLPPAY